MNRTAFSSNREWGYSVLSRIRSIPSVTVCGTPESENTQVTCTDGQDNDRDRYIDCQDFDCAAVPDCAAVLENTNENCADQLDNDGDGYVDCADYSCSENPNVSICP